MDPPRPESSRPGPGAHPGVEYTLAQRRSIRARPARQLDLSGTVDRLRGQIQRSTTAEGKVQAAWTAVAPEALRSRAQITGLKRGVLSIKASDAAARYQIDRWLRTGGEKRLREAARISIGRIRVTI